MAQRRTQPERLGLERVGDIQDRQLLSSAEIIVDQEVSQCDASATWSRRDGNTPMKLSSSSALMISGGRHIGSGALMTKPAASAVSTTAEAIGSAKSTACSRPRPRTPLINR